MVRYGVEVEGRFKGQTSLVVFTLADHRRVKALLAKHNTFATHVWLELTSVTENFDWDLVEELAKEFNVTVLVRKFADIPTYDLPKNVCLVWKAPATLAPILSRVEYIQSAHGLGLGCEFSKRSLSPKDYEGDEVWES